MDKEAIDKLHAHELVQFEGAIYAAGKMFVDELCRSAGAVAERFGAFRAARCLVPHRVAKLIAIPDPEMVEFMAAEEKFFQVEGRHHVIFRFQQNYPRNCPDQTRYIPVTYDWIFSTGRDNPVYGITYDVATAAQPTCSTTIRARLTAS